MRRKSPAEKTRKEAGGRSGRRGPAPAGARRGSERVQRARSRAPDVALTVQSDSVAATRGAELAEQVPGTRGTRSREGDGEVGESQVRRARGAAGVRSGHTPLHRDSPSTWLPGSPRKYSEGKWQLQRSASGYH